MLDVDMSEKENSDYFNTSLRTEDEITKSTLSQFKKQNESYKRSFNLLYDLTIYLYDLTKSKTPSRSKFAILTMLPRLFGTMQSIRILTMKGYYYDTVILERSFVENLGLFVYLAKNEEEARNWLIGKDISIPKIKLLDELFSLMSKEMKKHGEGRAMYGKLSQYVHASLRAIGPSFVTNIDKQSGRVEKERKEFSEYSFSIEFPPFFRKQDVPDFAVYPMVSLIVIMELFKNELEDRWVKKIRNILREYMTAIKSGKEDGRGEKT